MTPPGEFSQDAGPPGLDRYLRAANYLAAAQIYLRANPLLREPLRPEHIKDRLLGHWGTCPGINLICAHLNRLILREDLDVLLVTGPGHGAPANLANLYLEGSLREFYPALTHDAAGLEEFVRVFSWTCSSTASAPASDKCSPHSRPDPTPSFSPTASARTTRQSEPPPAKPLHFSAFGSTRKKTRHPLWMPTSPSPESAVRVLVVKSRETWQIARECHEFLRTRNPRLS